MYVDMQDRKALIVGVDEYNDKVGNLSKCKNDAISVSEMLEMREYEFDTDVITNKGATRRRIRTGLKDIFNKETDFSLFYFAGHGAVDELGGYLLPTDTDDLDIGIRLDIFEKLINKKTKESSQSVIILDCCHSGSAKINRSSKTSKRVLKNKDVKSSVSGLGEGSALLAACKPNQEAYEDPSLDHGIFTYYLIQALYGKAANESGNIDVNLMYSYISNFVEKKTGQVPVFKGSISGSIVLGSGFQPQSGDRIPENTKESIERKATQLANDQTHLHSADIDSWKTEKYKKACKQLKPIIEWFTRKENKYPRLKTSEEYKSAKSTIKSHLQRLANLQVGTITPEGKVSRVIGSGTFGSVWRLEREDDAIAYKVFHPSELEKEDKKTRFERGFKAMDQLDHPHIVDVHKFTRCPIGFTMDFIDGPNLRDYAPTKDDPLDILSQLITVSDTLNHSHSRNVLHRDVKPENIVMSWEGTDDPHKPHLTDFDLAWFDTATKFTTEAIGTMTYAPPEQLNKPQSSAARNPKVDIYSFGQLLFFFITESDPVPKTNNVRRLRKAVSDWISEEPARKLVSLYEDCTHNKSSERLSDFQEISDILFDIKSSIEAPHKEDEMDFENFSREIIFSIVGLSKERIKSKTTFLSTSGRTKIEILNDLPERIVFRLKSQTTIAVKGSSNYEKARREINKNIDRSLNNFDDVDRKSERTGRYGVKILMNGVPLRMEGVEKCRSVLARVIDSIENT